MKSIRYTKDKPSNKLIDCKCLIMRYVYEPFVLISGLPTVMFMRTAPYAYYVSLTCANFIAFLYLLALQMDELLSAGNLYSPITE